jgi:hypothetical protein
MPDLASIMLKEGCFKKEYDLGGRESVAGLMLPSCFARVNL